MPNRQLADGEPRFQPGSAIQTPFWGNPVTIDNYDDQNGVYKISGPNGATYRLVIIEEGYKRLYPHGKEWEYNRGTCDFDEIQSAKGP